MIFVRLVTVTTSRPRSPSFSPVYTKTLPGFNGNQGLVTVWANAGCAARADAHATQTTTPLTARADRNDLAARCIDPHLLVPDVDHVDDRAVVSLEIDLAERASRRVL